MLVRELIAKLRSPWYVSATILIVGLVAIPQQASATVPLGCSPHGSATGKKFDAASIGEELALLDTEGASDTQVDSIMATDWCLQKISERTVAETTTKDKKNEAAIQPMTAVENSNDVEWLNEELYVITGGSDRGNDFAYEKWSWVDHDYTVDDAPLACGYNDGDGGQDGMGLGVSNGSYKTVSQALEVYGDPGLDAAYEDDYHIVTITGGAHTSNGASWLWQDNVKRLHDNDGACQSTFDLDDYRGIMTWEFFSTSGCHSNVYVQGGYDHTWNSSGVTGVSIGLGPGNNQVSIGFGVTGSNSFENDSYGVFASTDLC